MRHINLVRMMIYRITNIFVLFLLSINTYALEQEIPDPVQTKIVTNSEKAVPGQNLRVGVYFKLDPGWHIYWKNSGDSGLPTKVNYAVPKGFEVKQTHYPVPRTLLGEGNILDYGYEDELLLVTDIYVPKDATNTDFEIKSEARWVVCKEVCIPGSKNLDLQFPIKSKSAMGDQSLFAAWQSKLPVKIGIDNLPFKYIVEKKYNDENKLNFVNITFNWNEKVTDMNFYPNSDRSVYLKDIELKNHEKISSYSFSPVIFKKGIKDIEEIEFVISYKDSSGQTKGIETIIDLKS